MTDKGKTIRSREDLNAYRTGRMRLKYFLHPVIAKKVQAAFQNAEYNTAVFQALREVEVEACNDSGFSPTDISAALMRKTFAPKIGPLRDDTAMDMEKLAVSEMFAGLIAAYKIPTLTVMSCSTPPKPRRHHLLQPPFEDRGRSRC